MYKNVLVPTDGSPAALDAAAAAAELVAPVEDAYVTAMVAVPPVEAEVELPDSACTGPRKNHRRQQAEWALQATEKVFLDHDVACSVKLVEERSVSRAIAKEAEDGHYDLIVMGGQGMGTGKHAGPRLGSVTARVIQQVYIPVLVIPGDKPSPDA